MPFNDCSFDAVYTVGGINYFRDSAEALREMRRVVKPGGTLIAADEKRELYTFGIGHMIGLERLDAWWLGLTGLDHEFIEMVFEGTGSVEAAARDVWPSHRRYSIWNRLGYCLVDQRVQ